MPDSQDYRIAVNSNPIIRADSPGTPSPRHRSLQCVVAGCTSRARARAATRGLPLIVGRGPQPEIDTDDAAGDLHRPAPGHVGAIGGRHASGPDRTLINPAAWALFSGWKTRTGRATSGTRRLAGRPVAAVKGSAGRLSCRG